MRFSFEYTGIRVKNMEESLRFYTEVLGMVLVRRDKAPPTRGEGAELKSPSSNQLLELNYYGDGSPFATPYVNGEALDHLAFVVSDLRAAVDELRTKGVVVLVEPYAIGAEVGWKEAFVQDPNGIWIELLERP